MPSRSGESQLFGALEVEPWQSVAPHRFRVLHVTEPGAAGSGPCTLRLLASLISALDDFEHCSLVLGGQQDAVLASGCGLDVAGWSCPPGLAPFAGQAG